MGDPGLIPGLGGSPGEGNGYSLQFLPGEFHRHGQRSLVAHSSCGPKELDMTDVTEHEHEHDS